MSGLSLPDGCASSGKCCKQHSLNVCKAAFLLFPWIVLTYPSIRDGTCFHCGVQIDKEHRMDTALWRKTSQSDTRSEKVTLDVSPFQIDTLHKKTIFTKTASTGP